MTNMAPTDDDEISLFEIYEILSDSWHSIALLAVVGAALAAVLAFVCPKSTKLRCTCKRRYRPNTYRPMKPVRLSRGWHG